MRALLMQVDCKHKHILIAVYRLLKSQTARWLVLFFVLFAIRFPVRFQLIDSKLIELENVQEVVG